ncbi:response regulator receiver domain-containing protein [Steroidobacter denitrificans]|uniref:Response regulator receiver domain-containing protein n=1 Tax=Steroidobacter denitrificans TaxID=465721 RepID=A0A127FEF4_STEDE|nr:HD domain-containing phosphohydrolase [Steroidobacter denitrificans]AMN48238.1 response regulator receiver domain-containing protein [Steroidobacter denitrificans]
MSVILIAFERESEQSAIEQLLSSRGHRVMKSANGLVAWDTARREPPHAIISDIVLPRMDGFALCRKWKQDERLQSVPFLFYTRRHDDPKYERFALELGAERFLARSAQPESLLAALDEVLGAVAAANDGSASPASSGTTVPSQTSTQATTQIAAQGAAQGADRTALIDTTSLQRIAALEAALNEAQRAHAEARNTHAEALEAMRRDHARVLENTGRMHAEALAEMQQAHASMQAQMAGLKTENQRLRERDTTGRVAQLRQTAVIDLLRGSTSADEATILRYALEQTAAVINSPLAWLHFVDHAKNPCLAGWFDTAQRQAVLVSPAPRSIQPGEFLEACIKGRQAVAGSDAQPKAQQDGLPALGRYLAVPAVVNDEVVAVLGVANRDADYAQDDQQGLLMLADSLLRIIQMKRAQSQALKSFQRADVALQGMIDSFVRVGEHHDPYTAGSARRLAALAVAIGREAGLDGERQHALRVAAMLHDIGNIAVPASILSKPAPLTETELALMRTHVDEGCQLLADIDFGAPIADIIYQSHERYDGSGYPRGLKATDILLEARILAIADTVEAMCSSRSYRPAADMAAAIEEIRRGAGRLYDPYLAEACIRLIDQHGYKLPE